jgi:hypothetical protein
LIKAGANHKDIGKKLNDTISSINEQVKLCQLDLMLMQTKEINALTMRLYAEVFRLLHLIMRYFSSKFTRFLAAFNENVFEDRFGYYIKDITSLTDCIRKGAELGSRAKLRDMHLSTRYMFMSLDSKLDTKVEEIKKVHRELQAQQGNCLNWFGAALFSVGLQGKSFL